MFHSRLELARGQSRWSRPGLLAGTLVADGQGFGRDGNDCITEEGG
jgi:hypothetical protein